MPEPLKASDLVGCRWLLAGYHGSSGPYHFARVSRQTYSDSPFLDHRIQPMPTQQADASAIEIDRMLEQHAAPPIAPTVWILHTAFCASTLLASCLDEPGSTLVLKEPLVLSRLAQDKRDRKEERDRDPDWSVHCDRVLRLVERSDGAERAVIKPSNFANTLGSELLATNSDHRRLVLMSSSLDELLVSILKKREEAERLMPGFLTALLQDSDYTHRVGAIEPQQLDLLQQAVVFWHCQRYQLQRLVESHGDASCLMLTMRGFFDDPRGTLESVAGFGDLPLSSSAIDASVQSKVLSSHSKSQGSPYSPQQHRAEADELKKRFGRDIDKVKAWAEPLLASLPTLSF